MSEPTNPSAVLSALINSLRPTEVLTPSSPDYANHSSTFSAHRQKSPALVFAPESVDSLSRVVRELYASGLDFDVRGHGFKCTSSDAVVVSMKNFNDFSYDKKSKLASVGAGLTWVEVCSKMTVEDPEYATLVARTARVGVGGSVMLGGYSWRSGRLGCISDPANFVDAEVVKFNGEVVMASKEPELMWALRGGGGGFGIVTKVILRAHSCSTKIWAGNVLIPRSELSNAAKGLADLMEDSDPAYTAFMYIAKSQVKEAMRAEGEKKDAYAQGDHLVVYVYDEYGEEHGRKAFSFLLEAPGAIDATKVTNIEGVTNGQANVDEMRGKAKIEFQTFGMSRLSYDTMMKAVSWFDDLPLYGKTIQQSAMLVFEFKTLGPINGGTAKDCAYPRPSDFRHVLLVSTGCAATASDEEWKIAHQVAIEAPRKIFGEGVEVHVTPPALEEFHNARNTYGEHYEKIGHIRRKYDPEGRFKAIIPVA